MRDAPVGGGAAMHQRLHAYYMYLGNVLCTVSAEDGVLCGRIISRPHQIVQAK